MVPLARNTQAFDLSLVKFWELGAQSLVFIIQQGFCSTLQSICVAWVCTCETVVSIFLVYFCTNLLGGTFLVSTAISLKGKIKHLPLVDFLGSLLLHKQNCILVRSDSQLKCIIHTQWIFLMLVTKRRRGKLMAPVSTLSGPWLNC